ncbi:MAG: hypothetical protein L0206_03490, partial [Actinobacteria bacterium]|nr:hypothetical protein [Actinomycetota bacterium]
MTTGLTGAAERAWVELHAVIELEERFWLGFVMCDSDATLDELAARADRILKRRGRRCRTVPAAQPDDLARLVPAIFDAAGPGVGLVWVRPHPTSTDAEAWDAAWIRFLNRMNEQRDSLSRGLASGLVVSGPSRWLGRIAPAASDLWSFRRLVLDIPAAPATRLTTLATEPGPLDVERWRELAKTASEEQAITDPAVRRTLVEADRLLAASKDNRARELLLDARDTTWDPAERACLTGYLARAELDEDPAAAARHAEEALTAGVPLGRDLARSLLDLVADHGEDAALEAAIVHSESLRQDGSSSAAGLLELSRSFDRLGELALRAGRLDDAEQAFLTALDLDRRRHEQLGETPEILGDLAESLERVGDIAQHRGHLDEA